VSTLDTITLPSRGLPPRAPQASRAPQAPRAPQAGGAHRPRRAVAFRPESAVFFGLLAVYLAVGFWLVLAQHSIMEDALSRVANASYVIDSRQPKLANVGFVWTPLPSLLLVPFLPLKFLWPPLVTEGLLGNILSAIAMAASARVLCGLLDDLGVSRRVAIAVAIAYGLQPMIIWFGANGMTEALLVMFVLLASRRLVRWSTDPDPRHLMMAGTFVAIGYLARYEVLASGAAAVVVVGFLSWWRTLGDRTRRRDAVVADVLLVGAPLAAIFTLWALASWIIVGHPFDQFSSAYGNSAIVEHNGVATSVDLVLPAVQWLVLAPLLPAVFVAAGVLARRRRDLSLLAPVGLLTAITAFELLIYSAGSLFGFLRYQIVVIPLSAVLVGYLCRGRDRVLVLPQPERPDADATIPNGLPVSLPRPARHSISGRRGALPSGWRGAAAVLVAVLAMVPGVVTSGYAFLAVPALASQEWEHVRPAAMVAVGDTEPAPGAANGNFDVDRDVGAYLDAQRLPVGSVVLDSGPGFAVLAATANPRQFVITSDLDFTGATSDPVGHHIRFLLVSGGQAPYDAVGATWPTLVHGGPLPFWAKRAVVFPKTGLPGSHDWTLWAVQPAS